MTTLLDNTGLPLWVYIVLIVVGSVLFLVLVAILLRWWYVRRRAKSPEYNGLTGATRRMTVRRGRMVPTSQHLSLTGSKFGMRQFGLLADNESTLTGRRSPFEWWNTMVDRSHSRQDSVSQMEAGSIHTRPSSRATTVMTRREYMTATPTRTPEKVKEPAMRTTELTIPSPSPSPTLSSHRPSINFSRSFAQKVPSSPLTQRSQYTLSRIEERSPPTSTSSNSPIPAKRSSYLSAIHPLDNTPFPGTVVDARPSSTALREPVTMTTAKSQPAPSNISVPLGQSGSSLTSFLIGPTDCDSHRLSASAASYAHRPGDLGQSPIPPRPKTAGAATSTSRRNLSQDDTRNFSTPRRPTTLAVPKPVMQATNRRGEPPHPSSMYQQANQSQPNLSKRSSTASQRESAKPSNSKSGSRKSSISIGTSGIVYESQLPDYWTSRTDLQDLSSTLRVRGSEPRASFNSARRNGSNSEDEGERDNIIGIVTVPGKNNNRVLRKKSLRRLQPQK
ncbi:uncharacterized protein A1O9_02324, partial [Exophiala aquamarina CBS 119918]